MEELLTLEEIASYLRVNERTVYRLANEGGIPAIKIGHLWRFRKSVVDEWLDHKSTGTRARILVVDDDDTVCALFQDTLEEQRHAVTTVTDANKGLDLVKSQDYDLVFLDLKMPGMDGAELFRQIRMVKPGQPVTISTGFPDSELMMKALAHGPFGVMKKPFGESDILTAVNSYLRFGMPSKEDPAARKQRRGRGKSLAKAATAP